MLDDVQKILIDPKRSFWVEASAGSGKTRVLVERIITLLESGVMPEHIVMLTFTKTAAQEVVDRVLKGIHSRVHDSAWALVWQNVTQKDTLKAYTIHSFCQKIWQMFSLEAGWGMSCSLGDDEEQWLMQKEALNRAYKESLPWMKHLFVQQCSQQTLHHIIMDAYQMQRQYGITAQDAELCDPFMLYSLWEETPKCFLQALTNHTCPTTKQAKTIVSVAVMMQKGFTHDVMQAYMALFLKQDGGVRTRLFPKEMSALASDFVHESQRIEEGVKAWRKACDTRLSFACSFLLSSVHRHYTAIKKNKNMADYQDLIALVSDMVSYPEVRAYISSHIHHLLVDEAQDTSMMQWKVIVGVMSAMQETLMEGKSVFVVGDDKQSIYSFQGVRTSFTRQIKHMIQKSLDNMDHVVMERCYRCSREVIDTINAVSDAGKFGWVMHQAVRVDDGGVFVEEVEEGLSGEERAIAIAKTIALYVQKGYIMPSLGRALYPEDILILARQRDEVFSLLPQALLQQGIPCNGEDKAYAMDNPLIQSVVLLMDFCVLPDDDVVCACVLRSPWVGWSSEQLQDMILTRTGSIWSTIQAEDNHDVQEVCALLKALLQWSYCGVSAMVRWLFTYKEHVVMQSFGGIAKESFLQICQTYELSKGSCVASFSAWLRAWNPVFSPTARKGVKLMTVHGAKGLEAPCVFIIDADRLMKIKKQRWVWSTDERLLVSSQGYFWDAYKYDHEEKNEEHIRLMYVAMTRAQDVLVLMGVGKAEEDTWKSYIKESVRESQCLKRTTPWQQQTMRAQHKQVALALPKQTAEFVREDIREDAQQEGILYHRLLMMLIASPEQERYGCLDDMAHDYEQGVLCTLRRCLESQAIAHIIAAPVKYLEMTFTATIEGLLVVGRPDVVYIQGKTVYVVDFKTTRFQGYIPQGIQEQMKRYEAIMHALYPEYAINVGVFFVHEVEMVFAPCSQ